MKKKKKLNNPPRNKNKLSELNNRIYKNKTKLTLSVQFSTVAQLCPTLCDPVNQASLSITNSWSPPKPMSIQSVMPSNYLILCHPLLLPPSIFPSIRVFSDESVLCIMWPKYWSFSFSISPSSEYSRLISFRMDWLDLLAVQGVFVNGCHLLCSSCTLVLGKG